MKYLAGAYRVAGGNADRAVHYYASGYYYAAKRKRRQQPSPSGGFNVFASANRNDVASDNAALNAGRLPPSTKYNAAR